MSGSKSLEVIAHHEAAHAVVSFFLHVPIRFATIEPTKDWLGCVDHPPIRFSRQGLFDDSPRGIDRAERHIKIFYAGALAQKKLHPRSHWRDGCEHDFYCAGDLFMRICDADPACRRHHNNLLWRRTEVLIDSHWQDIRAVAAALIERRKLDQDELRAVIFSARGLDLPLTAPVSGAA